MEITTQNLAEMSTFSIMKPIEILKKCLAKLCGQIQGWKTELEGPASETHNMFEASDTDFPGHDKCKGNMGGGQWQWRRHG